MIVMHEQLRQTLLDHLPRLIQQVKPDVSVPARGEFPPVKITIVNPERTLFAGKIHLIVRGGFETEANLRFFDVKVETPSGHGSASIGYPFIGTKTEILRALEGQLENPEIILDAIRQTARTLRTTNKA